MKILVIGATGTIGKAVVEVLQTSHDVVAASRSRAAHRVDVTQEASLAALLQALGPVDGIVSLSGGAKFAPLSELKEADYQFSLANKLMGQVNVARLGMAYVRDGGSITLTSGVLAWHPMPGGAAISMVNGALEGFVAGAAHEAPRGIRVNVVSPPWVTETLQALKMDPSWGRPAREVAALYAESVAGSLTGHHFALGPTGHVITPLAAR